MLQKTISPVATQIRRYLICLMVISVCVIPALAPALVFVDQANASGTQDGLTWATAYTTIQAAIADPRSETEQIFVARGIYPENIVLTNSRQIYGGFEAGDTNLGDRDFEGNKTTILATGPAPRRALTAIGTKFTVVEGFSIGGGQATGAGLDMQGGGALYFAADASNTLRHCTFDGNSANGDGGGMAVMEGSSPAIDQCTFTGNTTGDDGGGIYITNGSNPILTGNWILNNMAGDLGGGFYVSFNSSPFFDGNLVDTNKAREGGGGFFRDNANSQVDLTFFVGNVATERGGGVGCAQNSTVVFDFCFFQENEVEAPEAAIRDPANTEITGIGSPPSGFGGCVYVDSSAPVFIDCTFDGGAAQSGGGLGVWNGSPLITNALFQSIFDTSTGGGVFIAGSTGTTIIEDSVFFQINGQIGSAIFANGGVTVRVTNSEFDGCGSAGPSTINSSVVYIDGGATALVEDCLFEQNFLSCIFIRLNSNAHINRCQFVFNNIFNTGSIIVAADNSQTRPLVTNCLLTSNIMNGPGAISAIDSNLDVVNCTLDRNSASSPQSSVYAEGASNLQIVNSIIANSARHGINRRDEASATIVDSCLFWNNPFGDYRDEPEDEIYSDAAGINMFVPGALDNISGDPRFEMHDVIAGHFGTLDAVTFDEGSFTTLLTDHEASFPFGGLVGRYIYFNNDIRGNTIFANSTEVIGVQGNRTNFIFPGDKYRILDYRLTRQSAAVDRGRTDGSPADDFLQLPRPVETSGAGAEGRSVDIGAFELQLPNFSLGESWMIR